MTILPQGTATAGFGRGWGILVSPLSLTPFDVRHGWMHRMRAKAWTVLTVKILSWVHHSVPRPLCRVMCHIPRSYLGPMEIQYHRFLMSWEWCQLQSQGALVFFWVSESECGVTLANARYGSNADMLTGIFIGFLVPWLPVLMFAMENIVTNRSFKLGLVTGVACNIALGMIRHISFNGWFSVEVQYITQLLHCTWPASPWMSNIRMYTCYLVRT